MAIAIMYFTDRVLNSQLSTFTSKESLKGFPYYCSNVLFIIVCYSKVSLCLTIILHEITTLNVKLFVKQIVPD